jgi:hypothetical protein
MFFFYNSSKKDACTQTACGDDTEDVKVTEVTDVVKITEDTDEVKVTENAPDTTFVENVRAIAQKKKEAKYILVNIYLKLNDICANINEMCSKMNIYRINKRNFTGSV